MNDTSTCSVPFLFLSYIVIMGHLFFFISRAQFLNLFREYSIFLYLGCDSCLDKRAVALETMREHGGSCSQGRFALTQEAILEEQQNHNLSRLSKQVIKQKAMQRKEKTQVKRQSFKY